MASPSTPTTAAVSTEELLGIELMASGLGTGPPLQGIMPSPAVETIAALLAAIIPWGDTLIMAREPTLYAEVEVGLLLVQGMERQEIQRAAEWATNCRDTGRHTPVVILITPTLACVQALLQQTEQTRLVIICLDVLAAEDTETPAATMVRLHSLYPAVIRRRVHTVITAAPITSECFGGFGSRDCVTILRGGDDSSSFGRRRITLGRSSLDLVATRVYIEATNGATDHAQRVVTAIEQGGTTMVPAGLVRSVFPKGETMAQMYFALDLRGLPVHPDIVAAGIPHFRPEENEHLSIWIDGEQGKWITASHGRSHADAAELLALFTDKTPACWRLYRNGTFAICTTPVEWQRLLQLAALDSRVPLEVGGRAGASAYEISRARDLDTPLSRVFEVTSTLPGKEENVSYQIAGIHTMTSIETQTVLRRQLCEAGLPGNGPLRSAQVRDRYGKPVWATIFDVNEIEEPLLHATLAQLMNAGTSFLLLGKECTIAPLGSVIEPGKWRVTAPRQLIELEADAQLARKAIHARSREQDAPTMRWPYISSLYGNRHDERTETLDARMIAPVFDTDVACFGITVKGHDRSGGRDSDLDIYSLQTDSLPIHKEGEFGQPGSEQDRCCITKGLLACSQDHVSLMAKFGSSLLLPEGRWFILPRAVVAEEKGMICNFLQLAGDERCAIAAPSGVKLILDRPAAARHGAPLGHTPPCHRFSGGAVQVTTVSEMLVIIDKKTAAARKLAMIMDEDGRKRFPQVYVYLSTDHIRPRSAEPRQPTRLAMRRLTTGYMPVDDGAARTKADASTRGDDDMTAAGMTQPDDAPDASDNAAPVDADEAEDSGIEDIDMDAVGRTPVDVLRTSRKPASTSGHGGHYAGHGTAASPIVGMPPATGNSAGGHCPAGAGGGPPATVPTLASASAAQPSSTGAGAPSAAAHMPAATNAAAAAGTRMPPPKAAGQPSSTATSNASTPLPVGSSTVNSATVGLQAGMPAARLPPITPTGRLVMPAAFVGTTGTPTGHVLPSFQAVTTAAGCPALGVAAIQPSSGAPAGSALPFAVPGAHVAGMVAPSQLHAGSGAPAGSALPSAVLGAPAAGVVAPSQLHAGHPSLILTPPAPQTDGLTGSHAPRTPIMVVPASAGGCGDAAGSQQAFSATQATEGHHGRALARKGSVPKTPGAGLNIRKTRGRPPTRKDLSTTAAPSRPNASILGAFQAAVLRRAADLASQAEKLQGSQASDASRPASAPPALQVGPVSAANVLPSRSGGAPSANIRASSSGAPGGKNNWHSGARHAVPGRLIHGGHPAFTGSIGKRPKTDQGSADLPPQTVLDRWYASLPIRGRPVALLSGFDGTHTARLAVEAHVGSRPNLIVIMETDPGERIIVAEKFGYPAAGSGWWLTTDMILVLSLANVWDLVAKGAARLSQVISFLPEGSLIIAMWGSPCQDLTSYSEEKGELGFVGLRSVHMHIAHLTHWLLATCGRTFVISTNLENAGSMKPQMLDYVRFVFGRGSDFGTRLAAGDFSVSARNRFFFTDFAVGPVPERQDLPWDDGWNCLPYKRQGKFPPWLRSREITEDGYALYSTMLYHPNNMIYETPLLRASDPPAPVAGPAPVQQDNHGFDDADGACEEEFPATPQHLLAVRPAPSTWKLHAEVPELDWFELIPPRFHLAINQLFSWNPDRHEKMSRADEAAINGFKAWMQASDGASGFRTPRPHERLRDCGLHGFFFGSFRLQEMAREGVIADMTGNLFKLLSWLQAWGEGREAADGLTLADLAREAKGDVSALQPPVPLWPNRVRAVYNTLYHEKVAALPLLRPKMAPLPYPAELTDFIEAIGDGTTAWHVPWAEPPPVGSMPPNLNLPVSQPELCLIQRGRKAVGCIPSGADIHAGACPGTLLIIGSELERGGPWWQTWSGARMESFLSLNTSKARRTAAFALAICAHIPTDDPELDQGIAQGHKRAVYDYRDMKWLTRVAELEGILNSPPFQTELQIKSTQADIPLLLTALDILTKRAGPKTGVMVVTAKLKSRSTTWHVDKGNAVFLTEPKNKAHLLVISQGGQLLGLARQISTTSEPRGNYMIACFGQAGALQLSSDVTRCQAWGVALRSIATSPTLAREWKNWAGDRGLRLGTIGAARDSVDHAGPIVFTCALAAAITGRVEMIRTDERLVPLAQAAIAPQGMADLFPAEMIRNLISQWVANPAALPRELARAAQFGALVAIFNIADGGRSGLVLSTPPFAMFPPPLIPDSPPSHLPLCILLAAANNSFVPLLRIPSWATTPRSQGLYTNLRLAVEAQAGAVGDPALCVLGPADCVARAT